MKRRPDPLLRTQPWKIHAVFSPLDIVIARLEHDGTVETDGRFISFWDAASNERYDLVAALLGIVEFFELAERREYIATQDQSGLKKLAMKLYNDAPLFEADVAKAKAEIARLKQVSGTLRASAAADIIKSIQIAEAMEKVAA